jgi:hypothetical protein
VETSPGVDEVSLDGIALHAGAPREGHELGRIAGGLAGVRIDGGQLDASPEGPEGQVPVPGIPAGIHFGIL